VAGEKIEISFDKAFDCLNEKERGMRFYDHQLSISRFID
jgi:hypothetical protein